MHVLGVNSRTRCDATRSAGKLFNSISHLARCGSQATSWPMLYDVSYVVLRTTKRGRGWLPVGPAVSPSAPNRGKLRTTFADAYYCVSRKFRSCEKIRRDTRVFFNRGDREKERKKDKRKEKEKWKMRKERDREREWKKRGKRGGGVWESSFPSGLQLPSDYSQVEDKDRRYNGHRVRPQLITGRTYRVPRGPTAPDSANFRLTKTPFATSPFLWVILISEHAWLLIPAPLSPPPQGILTVHRQGVEYL